MANLRNSLLQRIRSIESLRSVAPDWPTELLMDYVFKADDIDLIAERVDSLEPQKGNGNPNTLEIAANRSMLFYNTSTNPPQQWFNGTVGATTGWVQL